MGDVLIVGVHCDGELDFIFHSSFPLPIVIYD